MSVVLPAYNEAETIETTVATTFDTLAEFLPPGSYEVVIAEDGCTDRTPEIAAQLARDDERVRHLHSQDRLGRGGALERAFEIAAGDTLVYFDTDLATDMRHLEELVESVRSGPYDVATGSRWMPGHEASRPAKRDVASRGFNFLVRLFLRSDVRDHQCGFKAFDRAALGDLLDDVDDEHWFWDTEVLVRAQRAGYRIHEFPVDWTPKGDTKVDLVRDVVGMGGGILRTWWELSVDPRITPRTTMVAGTLLIAGAVALMTQYLDPGAVLGEMRAADPMLILASVGLYLLSWPLRGLRYERILDELGYTEKLGFLTGAVFLSQTGNLVFPARAGDAVRAYIVKVRRGIPYPTGFASLAVERVFDLLTITVLAAIALGSFLWFGTDLSALLMAVTGGRESGRTGAIAAVVTASLTLAVVLFTATSARSPRSHVRAVVRRLSSDLYADRVASVVERFVGDIQRMTTSRPAFAAVAVTSLLVWLLDVATATAVFAAFDVGLPLLSVLGVMVFAVSVGNLAKVLPLSPGGIGLYEGVFSLLVITLLPGVTWDVALAVALVDHAVKNAVTVAGGGVSTAVLNVSLTTAVDEGREVDPPASGSSRTD